MQSLFNMKHQYIIIDTYYNVLQRDCVLKATQSPVVKGVIHGCEEECDEHDEGYLPVERKLQTVP